MSAHRIGPAGGSKMLGLAAVALLASGCFTYQPVPTVSLGDQARARLTVAEAVRQSDVTGQPVREIEGRVASIMDDRISFDVITARSQDINENFQFSTTYELPRSEIEELSLKAFSPARTAGAVAVVGGLIYLILDSTVIGGGGSGPGDIGDPADRIVRFRIAR